MKTLALVLLTFTACSQATQHAAFGRTVREIDPRIWCIHQSPNGDLWFGSNGNGIYRFHDATVTHYDQTDGLHGDEVRSFYDDTDGNLLVATNRGVTRFDGKALTKVEFVAEPTPLKDWVLDANDTWLVFEPGARGPLRYDGDKLYHMQLTESPAAVTHPKKDTPFQFDPAGVYMVFKDRRGHLWFGTAGHGLCRYDGETLAWMFEEHLNTTPSGGAFGIRSIFEDGDGHFWICNTRSRFKISRKAKQEDGHTLLQYKPLPGLPDAQFDISENFSYYPSVIEDKTGALWMACGSDGVVKFDGKLVTRFDIAEGSYACRILQDRDGKFWVGTIEHGVYSLEGGRFERFTPPTPAR